MIKIFYKNKKLSLKFDYKRSVKSALNETELFSSKLIKYLLKNGKIKDESGRVIHDNRYVKENKKIFIDLYDDELSDYKSIPYDLDILFEDDFFLIINKPPRNILFYTASNEKPCIASYVNHYYEKTGQKNKLRFVNRLDKDTSGILIIAKNRLAHNYIFNNHSKKYIAIVPSFSKHSGILNKKLHRVMPHTYNCDVLGKESLTRYRKIIENKQFSVMLVKIYTGRTHQIRVHFKHFEHPLIGDYQYGGMHSTIAPRLFLHCGILNFTHPVSGKQIKIKAPFLKDMSYFIEKIKSEKYFKFYNV